MERHHIGPARFEEEHKNLTVIYDDTPTNGEWWGVKVVFDGRDYYIKGPFGERDSTVYFCIGSTRADADKWIARYRK